MDFGSSVETNGGSILKSDFDLSAMQQAVFASSERMPSRPGWRHALLGGAAMSVIMFASGGQAWAACATFGSSAYCWGNVSSGVAVSDPITILNVANLRTNIAPASGVDGISFLSNGSIEINSNLGRHSIAATGTGADGIEAKSYDNGTVDISNAGNIRSADAYGINVETGGAILVGNRGDIDAELDGIHLHGTSNHSTSTAGSTRSPRSPSRSTGTR